MAFKFLGLLALSSLIRAETHQEESPVRCDSVAPPYSSTEFDTNRRDLQHPHSMRNWRRQDRKLTVDLWIHVIAQSDKSRDDGWVSNSTIDSQLAIMQKAYNQHGIFFNPKGRTFTVNPTWTESVSKSELEFKTKLRQGDYRTVNLFIIKNLGPLGRCYNPETAAPNNNKTIVDGCMIRPETLPGGPLQYESGGITAVHEVGHWFGLYHPFESHGNKIGDVDGDGCFGPGDKVADTGAQRWVKSGYACTYEGGIDRYRDTCKQVCKVENRTDCVPDPLLDPLDNFMGYCPDSNLTRFTDGQADRMFMIYDQFRKNA